MATQRTGQERGFSLVELIVVMAVLGILVAIVIPALLSAVDRSRQRRSMADMNAIAKANGMAMVDGSRFVVALADLSPAYILALPPGDGWGNSWVYSASGDRRSYTLQSNGKDGAAGPPPPNPWFNAPFEPDIVMTTGQFSQSPAAQ